MIVIPRGPCRAFPALVRKCVSGRPRGPAPVVVCEAKGGTLTVWAKTDDAVLTYTAPTACGDETLLAPMVALEAVAVSIGKEVELVVGPKLAGEARFIDRGGPKCRPFDAVQPGRQHQLLDPPDEWHTVPVVFLAALTQVWSSLKALNLGPGGQP
jgi:hypothetical protein